MTRDECIEKIRHIQKSMYTFIFEDGKSYKFHADDADKFYYYLDMIVKYLDEDVPKEKEPKTGHWITMEEGFSPVECSECGSVQFKKTNYCPSCGARMSESEEL